MTKSVITSATDATVSIFDVVATTASQTTKLVTTIGVSVDMLDTFVSDARQRQLARSAIDMHRFYTELAEDTARDISLRQHEIKEELKANPQLAQLYVENFTALETILKNLRNPE